MIIGFCLMPVKANYYILVRICYVMRPILQISHGEMVPYIKKCIHLGNTLRTSSTEHALIDSAITDINIKTNNLLSEFSFSESTTLSRLFQS